MNPLDQMLDNGTSPTADETPLLQELQDMKVSEAVLSALGKRRPLPYFGALVLTYVIIGIIILTSSSFVLPAIIPMLVVSIWERRAVIAAINMAGDDLPLVLSVYWRLISPTMSLKDFVMEDKSQCDLSQYALSTKTPDMPKWIRKILLKERHSLS